MTYRRYLSLDNEEIFTINEAEIPGESTYDHYDTEAEETATITSASSSKITIEGGDQFSRNASGDIEIEGEPYYNWASDAGSVFTYDERPEEGDSVLNITPEHMEIREDTIDEEGDVYPVWVEI